MMQAFQLHLVKRGSGDTLADARRGMTPHEIRNERTEPLLVDTRGSQRLRKELEVFILRGSYAQERFLRQS